jgi:hypothetical protein
MHTTSVLRTKLNGKEFLNLLTYLLMELSPSGGAANSAATQEFPSIYGTRRFITVLTRALLVC